jgi:hypothetical protein
MGPYEIKLSQIVVSHGDQYPPTIVYRSGTSSALSRKISPPAWGWTAMTTTIRPVSSDFPTRVGMD